MKISKPFKLIFLASIVINITILSSLAQEWHIETVDKSGQPGDSSSIAIDKSGFPHIVYSNYATDSFKYAYKNENGWQISTYSQEPKLFIGSRSLKFDDEGHPHIGYATKSGIKYAYGTFSGTTLTFDTFTIDPQGFAPTALTVDRDGKMPKIIYFGGFAQYGSDTLMLAEHGYYGGWSSHIIDRNVVHGYADISLNLNGYPVISNFAVRDPYTVLRDLFYYQDKSGVTVILPSLDKISFGEYVSMARKHDINYFAYQGDGSLYYTNGMAWLDCSSGVWHYTTYDKEEVKKKAEIPLFCFASLAVNGNQPVMCYRALDNSNKYYLEYAWKDSSGWHFSTIDKVDTNAPSLILDGFNRPFISYHDTSDPSNVVLKYAWKDSVTISHITPTSGLSSDSQMQMDIFPSTGYTFWPNPHFNDDIMPDTTVLLRKNGQNDVLALGVINIGTQIRCWFDLKGVANGAWDVVVQVPYARPLELKGGFNVGSSSGSGSSPSPSIGWVNGRVVDQQGLGIPTAEIWVDNLPTSIMTDNLGNYRLSLNPGTHRLAAKKAGFGIPPRGVYVNVGGNISQNLVGREYINLSSG